MNLLVLCEKQAVKIRLMKTRFMIAGEIVTNKDYQRWMPVKAKINNNCNRATFKIRDVFWASIGENIGFEEDGKGQCYNRPVVILKKFNEQLFWGIPLSTTTRRGKYYFEVSLLSKGGKQGVAVLSQLRLWDSARLENKIGMLSKKEFAELKAEIVNLFQ